jgi:predicted transcriptional regulator
MSDKLTDLQTQIIELLKKDNDFMSCDDIAWELKKHKMHIGNSVKGLVKKGILGMHRSRIHEFSNTTYYVL